MKIPKIDKTLSAWGDLAEDLLAAGIPESKLYLELQKACGEFLRQREKRLTRVKKEKKKK